MSDKKSNKMFEVENRCDVALGIYQSLINKTKDMCEQAFGKPTSYFDAERQRVLSVAHDIFVSCVSLDDIVALSDEKPNPLVEDVSLNDSARPLDESFTPSPNPADALSKIGECRGKC